MSQAWRKPRVFDVDIIGVAAVLALLAVGYFALVEPIRAGVDAARSARADLESAQRELATTRQLLMQVGAQTKQLRVRLESEDAGLKGAADANYRARLLDLAARFEFSLASIRPGPVERQGGAKVQTTDVQGRARAHGFARLLVALREEFCFHEVVSWSLRREAMADADDGLCEVRWTVRSQIPFDEPPSEAKP